eukprot:7185685-Alexandrium_andersonii.AAC.1
MASGRRSWPVPRRLPLGSPASRRPPRPAWSPQPRGAEGLPPLVRSVASGRRWPGPPPRQGPRGRR